MIELPFIVHNTFRVSAHLVEETWNDLSWSPAAGRKEWKLISFSKGRLIWSMQAQSKSPNATGLPVLIASSANFLFLSIYRRFRQNRLFVNKSRYPCAVAHFSWATCAFMCVHVWSRSYVIEYMHTQSCVSNCFFSASFKEMVSR